MTRRASRIAVLVFMVGFARGAVAQDGPEAPAPEASPEHETRPTGLPPGLEWTFNFDAGLGSFGFLNSLYTNPHDEPSGNLSDNWYEGYVKPALSGVFRFSNGSSLAGAASAVGERTYGGAPSAVGEDYSSFGPDDLWIGWRSGTASSRLGDDALSFTVGRAPYELGHGFLLYDGTGEGGSRGGYWSNARKAFQLAAIARVAPGAHTADVFYLDKDELPEAETGSRLWGANYEFRVGESSTFGGTYMKWFAHRDVAPGRDGLNVYNVRAYTAPLPQHASLSFEFEYAHERNVDQVRSNAWSLQTAYALSVRWTPKVSYRYAFFEGDDAGTSINEAFDPLFVGFSDWGTWWQGEIAGEYFLSNSNLVSHQARVHLAPTKRLATGVIVYQFFADQPAAYGPGVTARNIAFEVNAYADWTINDNVVLTLVGGAADPGEAVRQASGRTADFALGMVYLAYKY